MSHWSRLAASLLWLVACAPPADDTATWPSADTNVAWGNEDLSAPADLGAPPAPLVVSAPQLLTVGGTTTIVLTGVKPSAKVTMYGSLANPGQPPACPSSLAGGCLGLAAPARVLLTRTAGSSGTLSMPVVVPSPFGPALGALQVVETRRGVTRLSNVDTVLLDSAGGDYDGDGSSNVDEVMAGTEVGDPDTDGDGALDGADGCAFDATKAEAGACGCGEPEVDVDSDGVCDSLVSAALGTAVLIPAGTFTMGCLAGRDDVGGGCFSFGSPAHQVTLTRSFWMMEAEVTQAQYAAVMGSNPSSFLGSTLPVEAVSWDDALAFAHAVSVSQGLTPCDSGDPYACNGWRLPTEAEWEYAARGGEGFMYAGSSIVDDVAWYQINSGGSTHAVCTKARNGFGLCDMSGNVWEWTWDWFDTYPSTPSVDPTGPASGSSRMLRGGSWLFDELFTRVASRNYDDPSDRFDVIGFRLVRSVP